MPKGPPPTLPAHADDFSQKTHQADMRRRLRQVELPPADRDGFAQIESIVHVLVMTEHWCGDSLMNLPILARIVQAAPGMDLYVFIRPQSPELNASINRKRAQVTRARRERLYGAPPPLSYERVLQSPAMSIRFTKHAREKFELLARHKFVVTEAQVTEALNSPDRIESDRDPPIAQKGLDEQHVLRVVYRIDGDDKVVITFYPGRRRQYED